MISFDRHIQRIVIYPLFVFLYEICVTPAVFVLRSSKCFSENFKSLSVYSGVVDLVIIVSPFVGFYLLFLEKPFNYQCIQIDKIRIARKC